MADAVKNNTIWAVEEESTEGTYVAPAGVSSFFQVLSDGAEMNPSKELLEREIYGGVDKVTPRTGMKSVDGNIPVECRADATAGSAPEFGTFVKAALGTRRQSTTVITTKASGNTASVLCIEDADIAALLVGDIIMVKQSGAYHVTPIISRVTTGGAATVTVKIPHPSGDFTDSVTIEKFSTYTTANSGHVALSITKYVESAIEEKAIGCKVTNMSLNNFATGKIPSLSFGFEGLNFDRDLAAPGYTPSYDTALPPVVLSAKAYMDTTEMVLNEINFSLENTLGFKTACNNENGKVSSRVTDRAVTGTIDPYVDTGSIANYTKFLNNTEFSIFGYAMIPTVTGQFGNVVAFFLPKCIITEMAEADQDGILKESLSFSASRDSAGTFNQLYFSFI